MKKRSKYAFVNIVIGFLAVVPPLVVLGALKFNDFIAPTSFDNFDWTANDSGFEATAKVERDQIICLCGANECPKEWGSTYTEIEPTHIAYEGWLRNRFVIVKDPEAGDHPDWGRLVTANDKCLHKSKGEFVSYTLSEFLSIDSVDLERTSRLKLDIE